MVSSSSSRPLGITLDRDPRRRAAVIQALRIGRQWGLAAGYAELDRLAAELAATRAELEQLRQRYAMARRIIERADQIDALRERDGATMH
jgi:cell division protein FtsB